MDKGGRPVFCRKAGAIQERTSPNTKLIVVDFNSPILRWAIGPGWFQSIPEFPQKKIPEGATRGQFATLIRANASAVRVAMQG